MNFWLIIAGVTGAILSVGALIAALWKGFTYLAKVARLHPVILEMAQQFSTNGGSNLKDQMNRIEAGGSTALRIANEALVSSENSRHALVHQAAAIESLRVEIVRAGLVQAAKLAV